jgi:hypothetical protein
MESFWLACPHILGWPGIEIVAARRFRRPDETRDDDITRRGDEETVNSLEKG